MEIEDKMLKQYKNKNFVFISYSHMDKNIVTSDCEKFAEYGLNVWYDNSLLVGDKWDEKVKFVIESDQCVGVILYMSQFSLKSEAVEKELKIYAQKSRNNKNFAFILVSPYSKSVLKIISDIFVSLKDLDDQELEKQFPQSRLLSLATYLPSNLIYQAPALHDENMHILNIIKTLKEKELNVFDNFEYVISTLKKDLNVENIDGIHFVNFGCYPNSLAKFDMQLPNGIITIDETKYYTINGDSYAFEPIKWLITDTRENKVRLVSTMGVNFSMENNIQKDLTAFKSLAFLENERCRIVDEISIMTDYDLTEMRRLGLSTLHSTMFAMSQRIPRYPEVFFFKRNDNLLAVNTSLDEMRVLPNGGLNGYVVVAIEISLE